MAPGSLDCAGDRCASGTGDLYARSESSLRLDSLAGVFVRVVSGGVRIGICVSARGTLKIIKFIFAFFVWSDRRAAGSPFL